MATPRPKSTPGRSVEEHDRLAVLGLKAAAKDFSQMVAIRLSKITRPARLRWFNRGTDVKRKRGSRNFTLAPWEIARRGARGGAQIPRASRPLMDEKTIMRKVQAEAQKQFDSWQRISSRKGKG